jgi:hypothetical protein
MAMPWNAASLVSDAYVRRYFSACRVGKSELEYNDLSKLCPYKLRSWAPNPGHAWKDYVSAIENIPAGGWLIFQFHSFGGEGWDPITPELFDDLCGFLAERRVPVETVRSVVNLHRARAR